MLAALLQDRPRPAREGNVVHSGGGWLAGCQQWLAWRSVMARPRAPPAAAEASCLAGSPREAVDHAHEASQTGAPAGHDLGSPPAHPLSTLGKSQYR
eukprot:COSAG03_NODE_1248_length_4479_cov_1.974429_4_plen_97_part_00